MEDTTAAGPFEEWPAGLGFEYFYGFLAGEASQYEPNLVRNTTVVRPPKTPEEAITSRRSWLVSRGDVFDVRPSNQDQRTDPPMEAPNIGLNLAELARHINPVVRGSMQYYGAFYRLGLYPLLSRC